MRPVRLRARLERSSHRGLAMSTEPKRLLTPDEYLALDRASETKSEYLNGEVYAMVGASFAHVRIVANLVRRLGNQLEGSRCAAFASDLRLRVRPTGLYTYPDVIVACEPFEFADDQRDTLTNPVVLIEVLSESTQDYDRGGKFAHYRTLPSLREYLLFEQSRVHAEHFVRQADPHRWLLTETDRVTDTLRLDAIGAELRLAEVYDGLDVEASRAV